MSQQLIKARSKINSVRSYIKQEKLLPAIMSLHEAVQVVLRTPLMRNEKQEFDRLLDEALGYLNNDSEFRKLCPVVLSFKPGNEKELLESLQSVLEDLQDSAVEEAQQVLASVEQTKRDQMARGKNLLEKKKFKDAKVAFDKLLLTFREDTDLKAEVAELFLAAERYEDALNYLNQALSDYPESVHLYNRIAIVLRKMGKFETAESYFKNALKYGKDDAGLFFNMGRLYVDWKKWGMVEKTAKRALQIAPDFEEAQKMLNFARKKLEKEGSA